MRAANARPIARIQLTRRATRLSTSDDFDAETDVDPPFEIEAPTEPDGSRHGRWLNVLPEE